MQFINYFFASIISFLGLLIGVILVKIAPEEQKPLEKYLFVFKKILLVLIFVFVIFYYFNNHFNLFVLIVYLAFLLFIDYKISDLLKKSMITYIILGIIFFLSSNNLNLFTIESSLILLYGLLAASLMYNKREKSYRNEVSGELKNQRFLSNHYKIIFYNLGFLMIANLLFFL